MAALTQFLMRRDVLLVASALLLCLGGAAAWYLLRPTTLTIAVAPKDGTEPGLIKAYADALDASGEGIRLKILSFDDVRESAAALQDGRADLAVVRPDVLLPTNGLTLAILRDQAMIVASPEQAGIKSFAKLGGKRLGIGAQKDADYWLLKNLLSYHGLALETAPAAGPVPAGTVQLVPVDEGAVARPSRRSGSTPSSASSPPRRRRPSPSSARCARWRRTARSSSSPWRTTTPSSSASRSSRR